MLLQAQPEQAFGWAPELDGCSGSGVPMGEERVLRRMKRQHGLATRAQAFDDGMTRRQVDYCLATERWVRVARGVYRHTAVAPTPLSRLLAACMAHDGLASHRSAAAVHGIDGYRLGPIELTVPRGRLPSMAGVVLHQSSQLSLAKRVERLGVPCTGLARTVLDLASVVTRRQLIAAIDATLRDRMLRPSDLHSVLALHLRRGRNGCAALRDVLAYRLGEDPVPLSEWSRMVEQLLVDAGLDRPRLEYRVRGADGAFVGQVDLAYPAHRVAVELDSVQYHLNHESFVADPRRRNALTVAGWTVLSFTWGDYTKRPSTLCAQVAAACGLPATKLT